MEGDQDLTSEQKRLREECFATASRILGEGILRMLSTPPREAAQAAYIPGGPSVDALEEEIRGLQASYREGNQPL